ncbi:MAG: hypothetical protein EZS28_020555 [Streblomastix strix]|uniref:Uncharacterized protein n=1 Tax=Streblomastix strix TaxID=222440 RepID=A0A5J4VNF7_9EUKA|nr:MAG: hypothetical protein EZS28_020555 [Streblomastix strix]
MRIIGAQLLKDKLTDSDSDEVDEQVEQFKQIGKKGLGQNSASGTTRSQMNIGAEQTRKANTTVGSN